MTTPTDLLESLRATRDALAEYVAAGDAYTNPDDTDDVSQSLRFAAAERNARTALALAAADLAIAQEERTRPTVTPAVVAAMHRYGGRFVGFLAETWHVADPTNRARLESAFPELFAQYAEVAEVAEKMTK